MRARPSRPALDAPVTDVRNWFLFSASERYREDDTEHEHYADSAGQIGRAEGEARLHDPRRVPRVPVQAGMGRAKSRTFRFAVIDEAFGRGSDESTRFALELFEQLGLQLLIVTPLQKIHVIEPYVAAVGFVDNPTSSTPGFRRSRSRSTGPGKDDARARQLASPPRRPPSRLGPEMPGARLDQPCRRARSVRKRRAALLSSWAAGERVDTVRDVPLRGPGRGEIGERFDEVRKWAGEWERAAHGPLRVEYKKIGGRSFGVNEIPCKAWIDGYEQAWALLGAAAAPPGWPSWRADEGALPPPGPMACPPPAQGARARRGVGPAAGHCRAGSTSGRRRACTCAR